MSKSLATWFTPSLNVKSRSNGSSAVNSAAYRACITLHDERTGLTHPYSRKRGHIETLVYDGDGFSSLNENRELTFNKISALWNKAESADTRSNSRTMREVIIPLPDDFTDAQNIELSKDYAKHLRDTYGVAVQASLHGKNKKNRNTHLHLAFTTRVVNDAGEFKEKTRALDKRDGKGSSNNEVSKLREALCEITNLHAEAHGLDWYVYAGKFSEIEGMEDHVSTKHIPINATKDKRAEIEAANEMTQAIYKAKQTIKLGEAELEKLQNDLKREDEQRQEHAVNVPVVAPVVKSEPQTEIDIPRNWVDAHARYEELTTQRSHLEKQQREWLNQFNAKKKAEPEREFNIFKFETRKSKARYAAWIDEMNELRGGYQECTKKLDARKTALEDETLKTTVETYLSAIAHNERVKEERERASNERTKQLQLEREAEERLNRENPVDWVAKLDESNRSSHRTQSSSNGLTM